jgi:hypothetical protein
MKWIGPKTQAWEKAKRELKPAFEAAGITQCEFGFKGCWRNNGLSFAHCDKRRFLKGDQLYEVALACINCHDILERMPRLVMGVTVRSIITDRTRQPKLR